MRLTHRLIGIAVGALPIALVATLLAWPLWGRFEAATGIESLGHSGPAEWCFAAVYGLCVTVGVSVFARR